MKLVEFTAICGFKCRTNECPFGRSPKAEFSTNCTLTMCGRSHIDLQDGYMGTAIERFGIWRINVFDDQYRIENFCHHLCKSGPHCAFSHRGPNRNDFCAIRLIGYDIKAVRGMVNVWTNSAGFVSLFGDPSE